MRTVIISTLAAIAAASLVAVAAYGQPLVQNALHPAAMDQVKERDALNYQRPCQPKIGAPTKLDADTTTDADSGALTNGAVYELTCDTDHWYTVGAAAVTAAADSNVIYAGTFRRIPTGGSQAVLHLSVLGKTINGVCYLMQCF